MIMHEIKARKSDASKLGAIFADLAKNTMIKGKILIQAIISKLFLGTTASIACEQAVLVFAIALRKILKRFFYIL